MTLAEQADLEQAEENRQRAALESTDETSEETEGEEGDESGELEVQIGDEESPPSEEQQQAPQWVKDLRKQDREKTKRIRELEAERAKFLAGTPDKATQTLAEPTLEACEYDEDVYKAKLRTYLAQQAKVAEQEENARKAKEAEQTEATNRQTAYRLAAKELKAADYDDAEADVSNALSDHQQGILIAGCGPNAPKIVYALAKNPDKLQELASIKDPVKFAFAVAKLEDKVKVTPRKGPPAPERMLHGTAPIASSGKVDKTLERLEVEAERNGDRSKVIAYKRSLKAK